MVFARAKLHYAARLDDLKVKAVWSATDDESATSTVKKSDLSRYKNEMWQELCLTQEPLRIRKPADLLIKYDAS